MAMILVSIVLGALAASADVPRPEHPRPQFERAAWLNLNGTWTYEFDFGESGRDAGRELYRSKGFADSILVPFCPESKLSGVGHVDFIPALWYHRKVTRPAAWTGKRVYLRFGAVDWECEAYVDGVSQGVHFGGTSSFAFDVTAALADGREHDLVVRVADHSRGALASVQPRGKQVGRYESSGCYYTRVTGIWQTVWLEAVAEGGLDSCRIVPDFDGGSFCLTPRYVSSPETGARVRVTAKAGGKAVAAAEAPATPGATLVLKVPDARAWSPEDPFLYDLELAVVGADGRTVDAVKSYAGLRKIETRGNRLYLNGKPLYVRFVLDQGYYPDGVWTAPSDAALRKDIELGLAAGFNGARLHQKVFEERFHYWADRLGYLTWGESSSLGIALEDRAAARNFLVEWEEIVRRDANHPSIIAWTPLNETGYFEPSEGNEFKRLHRDCYDLTKAIDPTRPVNDASGYIHVKTDLWTVHCYDRPATLAAALGGGTNVWTEAWFRGKQAPYGGQPYLNDEFGGLKWIPKGRRNFSDRTWGYGGDLKDEEDFYRILGEEVAIMASLTNMSGWCYTQLTDVEQEQNGVYNYDRTPKFDMNRIRAIFSGTIVRPSPADVKASSPSAERREGAAPLSTAALQAEIDAVWRQGGGEVVIGPGEHRLKPVRLRSGVRLRLQAGAHVYGSANCEDYVDALARDGVEPVTADDLKRASREDLSARSQYALFIAFRAQDVEIVGEDGSFVNGVNCPDARGAEGYRGPHTFWFACSTNIVIRGVRVLESADYAYRFVDCEQVLLKDVSAEGGHDGVHFDLCNRVRILDSAFHTGDDSVAGSGCADIIVSNCVLNSACSPFRIGGRDVLITDCRVTGPAKHPHRWTLTREEKLRGAPTAEVKGRRTVGAFFQGYTGDVAHKGFVPGNMVVRNTTVENVERFMLSVSGLPGALWQDGRGITDITFENVKATGLSLPAAVVAKADEPMTITLRNCSLSFRTPQNSAFFGRNVRVIGENVKVDGAACLYEERADVSYDAIPEFPSWRIEPDEQRRKWGLPPLSGEATSSSLLKVDAASLRLFIPPNLPTEAKSELW